jgi:hypothetical protein
MGELQSVLRWHFVSSDGSVEITVVAQKCGWRSKLLMTFGKLGKSSKPPNYCLASKR